MSFLSDSTWWMLFVGANVLMAVLAIREAFRFRLVNGAYGKSSTLLAFLALPVWLAVVIVMIGITGWLSGLLGLVASFIFGQISLRIARLLFPGDFGLGEQFAQGEVERNLARQSIEDASSSSNVREVMRALSLNAKNMEDVYQRLIALGLDHKQAAAAIHNPKIIEWYFNNINSDGKFTYDQAIEFKLMAMQR